MQFGSFLMRQKKKKKKERERERERERVFELVVGECACKGGEGVGRGAQVV